jgi:hypothetical protein
MQSDSLLHPSKPGIYTHTFLMNRSGLFYAAFSTLGLRPTFSLSAGVDRRDKVVSNEKGTSMMGGPKGCEEDLSSQCSVCGRIEELFQLPGRPERYCLGCSADIATTSLLVSEIDAATLAGQNAAFLISEYEQVGARLLSRSQSAELGSF